MRRSGAAEAMSRGPFQVQYEERVEDGFGKAYRGWWSKAVSVCQCRAGSGLGIVLVETGVGGVKVQQMILGRTASNMQQSENGTVIRVLGVVVCRDASWHGCWVDPMFKM